MGRGGRRGGNACCFLIIIGVFMVILLLIKVLREMGGWKDGKDGGRDGLAEERKVHESERNGRRGMQEEGESGFPREGGQGLQRTTRDK